MQRPQKRTKLRFLLSSEAIQSTDIAKVLSLTRSSATESESISDFAKQTHF